MGVQEERKKSACAVVDLLAMSELRSKVLNAPCTQERSPRAHDAKARTRRIERHWRDVGVLGGRCVRVDRLGKIAGAATEAKWSLASRDPSPDETGMVGTAS